MDADPGMRAWLQATFRPALPASSTRHMAVTLAETAFFWLVFLLIVPLALSRVEALLGMPSFVFPTQQVLPWLAFTAAGALGLWSGTTMAVQGRGTPLPLACPTRLVVAGPYRFVRNPMAIAGLLQGACVGLALGSPLTLLYVLVGGVAWDQVVRPMEERDLEARFGQAFRDYRSAVRCWVPRTRPRVRPRRQPNDPPRL